MPLQGGKAVIILERAASSAGGQTAGHGVHCRAPGVSQGGQPAFD